MNLREALSAALRRDPEIVPKVRELLREKIDEENGRFATVVQAAEALEPVIAEAAMKRPSRLAKLGLSGAQLIANLAQSDRKSNVRLAAIARGSTVGIVFADVADFTEFTATHGDDAALQVLTLLRERAEAVAARHKGELVKTLGDGFLLAFPSSSQAIGAAIRLCHAGVRLGSKDPRFGLRIAVHAGEPSIENDDLLGHDVNLTARLLDSCKPGGVVVSEAAKELAEKRLRKVEFSKRKQVKVRGLAGKVTVHFVKNSSLPVE